MYLLSDGDSNTGSNDPLDVAANLLAHEIKVITFGYGLPMSSNVNHVLLEDISSLTGGMHFVTVPVDDPEAGATPLMDTAGSNKLSFSQAFIKALALSLDLTVPLDPWSILSNENDEERHPVSITRFDRKVAFGVNWQRMDSTFINVNLLTPKCELITPEIGLVRPH